jgi:hypothetical protein
MTYNFTLNEHFIVFDNFKQKQVYQLRNILESSRLMNDMEFSSYAIITTDPEDTHHIHPHITEGDSFNRIRTNCLVYDMLKTSANDNYYDKCFIYQTVGPKGNGFYGYFLYNTKTGTFSHVFNIEREDGSLCRRINKTINLLRHQEKYYPYKP